MIEKIELKPLLKKEFPTVKQWFSSPSFYFDTPNPDIISPQDIDFFLDFSSSRLCVIHDKTRAENEAIGLFDHSISANTAKADIELQFLDPRDWKRIGDQVVKKILQFLTNSYHLRKIEKLIYEFDRDALEVFSANGFECDGKYHSFLYKEGRYWDVFVFTYYLTPLRMETNV